MTNIFNVRAREAGREWAFDHPRAYGPMIDDAAPALNPVRRHFQDGANDVLQMISKLGKVFYRWEVTAEDGRKVGFTQTSDEALCEVKLWIKLIKQDGKKVLSHTIENQDGVITSGIFYRRP
jgi:hypothetical protein